jgi:hypothetical protein
MELVLNLIWLLLALAAIGLWRLRWTHQHQPRTRRQAPWREWTAVACALVLLFFVVSITDDLHADVLALEDSTNARRQVNCLSTAHHHAQSRHFPITQGAAMLPAPAQIIDLAVSALFAKASQPASSRAEQKINSGRAPPIAI